MITALDHIVLTVDDVGAAAAAYERLGFGVTFAAPVRSEPRAFVGFGGFRLVFVEPDDRDGARENLLPKMMLRSDDIDEDMVRLTSAGYAVTEIPDLSADGGGGHPIRRADIEFSTPLGLVEHRGANADHDAGANVVHRNSVTVPERTYIAVDSIERDLPEFEAILGADAPQPEMGTVIMSLMSVFPLGEIGLAIAEPRGAGPTADALASTGVGVFQVLFRAGSLDDAERVMVERGATRPERGTRLSGESALLVLPADAGGIYVALAGPD